MGLLSKLGNVGKAWNELAHGPGGSTLGEYIGGPPLMSAIGGGVGAGVGGLFGAADENDRLGGAARGAAMVASPMAMAMGGVGAVASGTMALRQAVHAIAKALVERGVPEELALTQAMKIAPKMTGGRADAWEALDKVMKGKRF